jgi:serine/threonine-protein kinase
MSIRSIDGLITALQDADLLSPTQMDELVMNLQTGFVEPAHLAEDLVLRRWLTLYQAKEIFLGRTWQLILGKYVVLDQLGAGGMAVVFKARHRHLGRVDALKVIRPRHLANPKVLDCFLHGAEAAARLGHANIVTTYDVDEAHGRHFVAMEYVEGTDLERLVRRAGPLLVRPACEYVRQAALGLQHAFERGVVHRDVKPHNLMLTDNRRLVKVLDMGLALLRPQPGDCPAAAEPPGRPLLMGTPDYMAPEQAADPWAVDTRADVYGLGCTLHFLLTGQPPFPDGEVPDKLLKHQRTEPPALEDLRADLPAGLPCVVRRMMAKDPRDRYQRPLEAARALQPFC